MKSALYLWFSCFLWVVFLAGCGGGGSSADVADNGFQEGSTTVSQGILVDPYIVGARVEEIAPDSSQVMQNSSLSNENGLFSFSSPVLDGSILRIKSSTRGMHANAPFEGQLKRRVSLDDQGAVVISPLTTLLANGMQQSEVIQLLEDAGITGMQPEDLTRDPMEGVVGITATVSESSLRLLQANMAVNTFLAAVNNYSYAGETESRVNLADCVTLSQSTLNADRFQTLSETVAASTSGTLTVAELANAAVEVQRTVVSQIRQDLAAGEPNISASRFGQLKSAAENAMATVAVELVTTRLNAPPGSGETASTTFDAAASFDTNCAFCHSISTSTSVMNLSGDGAKLATKFSAGRSHNGNTLSDSEVSAMADYLDGNVSTTPPTTTPPSTAATGPELYASECQGCHGSLATTNISSRTAAGISDAIAVNAGGMGSIVLSPEQIALISDSLPAVSPPQQPVADRSGVDVYDQECAICHLLGSHDPNGSIDLAGRGTAIITKIEAGHNGKTLSANELASLADYANTFGAAPPPATSRTAETIYNDICSACHFLTGYDDVGSIDLAGKGSIAVTKVSSGHGGALSTSELTAFAAWIDTFSPPAPPAVARDGETIYNDICGACHMLYGYDTVGAIDLASRGNTALTKLATGHGGPLAAEEQQNIAAWLDTWAAAPPPLIDRGGETVYNDNCAVCHKLYGYDNAGNIDLASLGNLVVTKLNTGHGGNVTVGEIDNISNWVDTFSPAPPPSVARQGQEIYDAECGGCHKVNGYDADGTAPDIASNGSGAVTKINAGHNGISLFAEELTNLSNWLDTYQAGDPYAGSCTACHGQPPLTGAHEVHTSLVNVGTDCAVCHETAAHNGRVDLAIQATWNAKSGSADSDGFTCSNISCHGGQTTPDWTSGMLDSSTQCKSCHSYGTSQYNSYYSGEHKRHAEEKRYDCLVCHDANKLGGHFSGLDTISFEQSPASTIKSSLSYSGRTCNTVNCHDSEEW